jgi:signal transduction histidine kinase
MSADRRIQIGFLLLAVVPLLLGLLTYRYTQRTVAASREVARTNELVKELEMLLSRLKDVEVAQREYILTGDEEYVGRIGSARSEVQAGVDRLATAGAEPRWVELLRTAIPQKFDEIDKTVRFRRSGDFSAASNVILQDRGSQAMDSIRTIFRNMILEENRRLERGEVAQQSNFVRTITLSAAILALNVALIISLFFLIIREVRRAKEINEELESRVALRTEELQRSNEDLQQFAYVASHDMKEPMRTISSYATLLQRRYEGRLGQDANTYIGFIVDGVRRMNMLITDLLEYSRAGESNNEEATEVDPEIVLSGVLQNLKVTIADTKAKITQDRLPVIRYDPVRLSQLLQNLIGNAIKYRAPGHPPVIHVSAILTEDGTVFSVRDNGPGIAAEYRETIFGIFKRLHGKEVEGTGIGLAMCRKIVERHGGRIWVESEPGEGSTFRFTVPHAQPAADSAAE